MGKAQEKGVVSLADQRVAVEHDGDLLIATGRSRFEKEWKNKKVRWSWLLARLKISRETEETHAEYMKLPKAEQDKLKDCGGFVGGHLKEGKRRNGSVAGRQIVTLDADFAPPDLMAELRDASFSNACAVYSTHKHCAAKPRVRLIIPLDREVTPDEYEAIARKVADDIGIDYFDDSTYQAARLMYWPSHSIDVAPVYDYIDGEFLSADSILAEYPDWTDVSYWPMSSRAVELRKPTGPAADPLAKKNIVGVFCRTYTVTEAIRKFLPDVYLPTDKEDRWTYAAGSTAAGLVIYNDDRFAWSNHATDPAAGQSCNAFDLVRIHLFGDLDEGNEDKKGADAPSYKEMAEFARKDPETAVSLAQENLSSARDDFNEPDGDDERQRAKWLLQFHKVSAKGIPVDIIDSKIVKQVMKDNRILIIEREPYIYRDGVYVYDEDTVAVKAEIRRYIFDQLVTASRLDRVYKLLQTEADLQRGVFDLNTHPGSWVNCRNGMLDLRTMQMYDHDPDLYSMNQVPCEFDPEYEVPEGSITADFLRALIPDDADREMFLEYAGYCLTTDTEFQKYLILTGPGGVGKSVLLDMIEQIVGRVNTSAIAMQKISERFQSRFLQGKLLNVFADLSSKSMEDTSALKMVLGEDDVPAEIKGGKSYKFKPYCKLLFSANRIPASKDEQTDAFYRRMLILPVREGAKRFSDLKERLKADQVTFFHMAIQAVNRAYARGALLESENSRREVRELYFRTDSVIAFLDTRTEKAPGEKVRTSDMYAAYEGYCLEEDRPSLSRIAFRANMREKGITVKKTHGVEFFHHIKLVGAKGGDFSESELEDF